MARTRRQRKSLADSRSSTCPHARRRSSGLPRSPSPAAVRKRSGSSCPTPTKTKCSARLTGDLGADVAGQCLQRGLVDEILVYVLPVLLGDGIRFSSPGVARTDLEPISST